MRQVPPIAFFTLFALGLEAIVGLVLGLSNGLSEQHKSILVDFVVAFPALTLLIFLLIMPREPRAETPPFRSRNAPEPLGSTPKTP